MLFSTLISYRIMLQPRVVNLCFQVIVLLTLQVHLWVLGDAYLYSPLFYLRYDHQDLRYQELRAGLSDFLMFYWLPKSLSHETKLYNNKTSYLKENKSKYSKSGYAELELKGLCVNVYCK